MEEQELVLPPGPGYTFQARDTGIAAERLLIAAWQQMPPWEKARRVCDLNRTCQELALIGIRARHPHADEREIRLRLAALRLDRQIMTNLLGWDPEQQGY